MTDPVTDAAAVAAAFDEAYGGPPEGVWAAPGRVNLIGEHTDYNDGFVLPFALPQRVVAAIARRDDGLLVARSAQRPYEAVVVGIDELKPGVVEDWAAYVAGAAWAVADAGHELPGLEIFVDGDVPAGAGLSSSAALECSIVHALDDLLGLGLTRLEQARLGQRAENDFVGAPTGMLDQLASMYGQAGQATFIDCRDFTVEPVPLDLAAAGLRVLIVDTRVTHAHTESGYGDRRRTCEAACAQLGIQSLRELDLDTLDAALSKLDSSAARRRVRHVVTENARVLRTVDLLRAGRIEAVGEELTASHESLSDDYEVSCPELDLAVDAALGARALGARMVGGGFGGSAIALVREQHVSAVIDRVLGDFEDEGYAEPAIYSGVPSEGARRLAWPA